MFRNGLAHTVEQVFRLRQPFLCRASSCCLCGADRFECFGQGLRGGGDLKARGAERLVGCRNSRSGRRFRSDSAGLIGSSASTAGKQDPGENPRGEARFQFVRNRTALTYLAQSGDNGSMLAAAALALIPFQAPDPLRLAIGRAGEVKIEAGLIVDLRSGKLARIPDIAAAADGTRFVYLGESHTNVDHHRMQAAVIEALVARGRDVVVAFEMFTRPVQSSLNPWTMGWWSEADFIEKSDWKKQWGFDYAIYKPIFDATRKHRLPMVALNVPRDWVRAVGRGGPGALPEEAKGQVPELDLSSKGHRQVFDALMGGHPPMGAQGQNIYAGQVLWDTAMADSAIKYLALRPSTAKTVFVVIAGSGHVMYGQGINYRVWKRTGDSGITLTMMEAEKEVEVSRGIGDFLYCAPPPKAG